MIRSKPKAWYIIFLSICTLGLNSCFWFNEPNADEAGSIELSEDEISGVSYSYAVFLNDSSNPNKGYGFSISINGKELMHQSHENHDGEIALFESEESAKTAAITTITSLKTRARSPEVHSNPIE
jgi:hypothetical protein